ncbi:MAG: DnaJ domain-containing protein [Candidatus Lernaella stagnicola]|nr:DnaJ domain-containing protein [Candidatus Lernaella stagnicola]
MRKVLVGESNYSEFAVLNDYLSGKGFEVHWVKTGPDAVTAAEQLEPVLVILDALIPGLTGLKVCQKVKKSPGGEAIKTILLSKVYRQFKEQYESRRTMGVDAYSEKPVNVADLDKVINRLIGDLETPLPRPAPEAGQQPEAGRRKMGTHGHLGDTPFPRLLFYLYKYQRTGALRVMHEQISKVIYFRDGEPVFVTSNLSNESLGRFMVQRGIITDEQYNNSLQRMLESGRQQGAVLMEMGVITSHELFQALQGQIREKILRIFAWDEGEYEFRPGSFTLDDSVQLEIPTLKLILDGAKRFYTLTRLERYFNEYKNQRLRRLKKSPLASGEMNLAPHEAKFFKLVDGKRSVGKIVAHSNLSLSETFQLLYYLLLAEVIRFVGDPGFAKRGVKEQAAFLADRKRRTDELRDLKDDKGMVLDDRRRRYRLAVSRAYDLLGAVNHYELLQIAADATSDQIRGAYHTLAKQYRPFDLYQDAEPQLRDMSDKVFNALTEAYETLFDPERRSAYNGKIWGRPIPEPDLAAPPAAAVAEPERTEAEAERVAAEVVDKTAVEEDDLGLGDLFQEAEAEEAKPAAAVSEDVGFADFIAEEERVVEDDIDTPDIEWDVGEDLAGGAETDAQQELVDFGGDDETMRKVSEAGKVTESMASLVRSELAFQSGEDALHRQAYDEAIAHFTEARDLNPNEAEYFAYLGWATFLGAPDENNARLSGRDLIEQALSINPVLDSGYTFLGMIHLREGDRDAARRSFEQALHYNPDNARAKQELAKLENV